MPGKPTKVTEVYRYLEQRPGVWVASSDIAKAANVTRREVAEYARQFREVISKEGTHTHTGFEKLYLFTPEEDE